MSAEAEDILYLRKGFCIAVVLFERASRQVFKKTRFDTRNFIFNSLQKKDWDLQETNAHI